MAKIDVNPKVLEKIAGKVAIITGGANGIGKATARLFYKYGAKVAVGDLDDKAGKALVDEFADQGHFVRTDIDSWASLSELFRSTFDKFGSVDCVCANAGMPEKGGFLFQDTLDKDGNLEEPDLKIIDVNVKGTLRTSKLALHYFMKNQVPGGVLVVTSSAAGYFGASPIINYATAKHALVGLMRSLAILACDLGFRVNLVAPWLTATEFSNELSDLWGDRPINSQEEVAEAMLTACADESLSGRTLFVAKQIVDPELPLHQLEPQWLGPEVAGLFEMGRAHLRSAFGRDPTHQLEQKAPTFRK